MKQLAKLGFQASRMLTDDQMKNVKGGDPGFTCSAPGPSKFCAASFCIVFDGVNELWGMCTSDCICKTDA